MQGRRSDVYVLSRCAAAVAIGAVALALGSAAPALGSAGLAAGAPLAQARRASAPGQLPLRSGRLTIELAARVYATLISPTGGAFPDHRSMTPIGPATARRPGSFGFPLAHGRLAAGTLGGSATTKGGISFSSVSENPALGQNSTVQFQLRSFSLLLSGGTPELTATFLGKTTYRQLPIASVVLAHAHRHLSGDRITLTGLRLKLLSAGAQLFNQQAFNDETRGFSVGETIGTATLTGVT